MNNQYMRYKYTIDTILIEISDADEDGQYEVFQQNVTIGYIYVSEQDLESGIPLWKGSSPYLNAIAPRLGTYIEQAHL